MNKWIKIGFPILCVLVVVITFALLHNAQKKIDENGAANTTQKEVVEGKNETKKTENVVEEVENETANTAKNEEIKSTVEKGGASSSSLYEKNNEAGSTQKKNEAIQMVKDNWGEDDTVTFRCDQVTGDGIYVIAVVQKQTGNVQNYFRVNLDENTVQVDY